MPDKKLFTPGPLGCSLSTKEAMLRDLGSRDSEFIRTVADIRSSLLEVAGVSSPEWSAVLLQGSGTYAVEAVLQTSSPREGARVLVLANGAYGRRMARICEVAGIPCDLRLSPETRPVGEDEVRRYLTSGVAYTLVAIVHCETSSGVMNLPEKIGALVRSLQPKAQYFVDAMSSFGAVPLNLEHVDWVVSSANKCLQGVPGFSYAICRSSVLAKCKGNARSLSLDLEDQDANMNKTGQFRFTPPTHALLAFKRALEEYHGEGALEGRMTRYKANRAVLKTGMAKLGFKELVPEAQAGHIITCFHYPNHPNFNFEAFYTRLGERDQVIYPGKVTDASCFRIGNIGNLEAGDMATLLIHIQDVLAEMGIPTPVS